MSERRCTCRGCGGAPSRETYPTLTAWNSTTTDSTYYVSTYAEGQWQSYTAPSQSIRITHIDEADTWG